MLFDLRGRGRQRTVRVIYLFLALLMGGGLVLFGIGGGGGGGGLVDAITGSNGSSTPVNEVYEQNIKTAETAIQRNRQDAKAWDELARYRYLTGAQDGNINDDGTLSEDGLNELRQADRAWTEHVKLAGDRADPNTAVLMIRAYGALGDQDKAVEAAEVFATSRNDAGSYLQYATVAYAANQTRVGDLAGKKAVSLATKEQKTAIQTQVDDAKQQALQAQAQQATTGATGATASATP